MQLYNKATGESLEVSIRPFLPKDVPQIISCIRDAYGESYVKPILYTEEGILHHYETGEMRFCVAEVGDAVIGITGYAQSPFFPGTSEIACQVIRREYNGFGLALPLAHYAMEQAEQLPLASQFSRALGCHLISQKTLKGMGFTACGFLLNLFDKEVFLHRFGNGNYAKIPQSIAVKRQDKTDAGVVWIPEELTPLADTMYRDLGLSWELQTAKSTLSGLTQIEREDLPAHATLILRATHCGEDFSARLSAALSAVADHPGQTVNLYLNLSCPGSNEAYQEALHQGFFFTGFLPCCAEGEFMILHHPLNVPVLLDDIPYIPEYAPFMTQIRRQLCNK